MNIKKVIGAIIGGILIAISFNLIYRDIAIGFLLLVPTVISINYIIEK
jgi:hypothetical protein